MDTPYRNTQGCFICRGEPVLERCTRCNGRLCLSHIPAHGHRCDRCELDWMAPLRGMKTIGAWGTVAILVGICFTLFVTLSAASTNWWSPEIEQIKWVGGGIAVGLIALFGLTQLWPSLRMERQRRRFLRERLTGERRD